MGVISLYFQGHISVNRQPLKIADESLSTNRVAVGEWEHRSGIRDPRCSGHVPGLIVYYRCWPSNSVSTPRASALCEFWILIISVDTPAWPLKWHCHQNICLITS